MIFFILDIWFGGTTGAGPVIVNIAPIVGRMLVYPAVEGEVSIDPAVDDTRMFVYPAIVGDVGGT